MNNSPLVCKPNRVAELKEKGKTLSEEGFRRSAMSVECHALNVLHYEVRIALLNDLDNMRMVAEFPEHVEFVVETTADIPLIPFDEFHDEPLGPGQVG